MAEMVRPDFFKGSLNERIDINLSIRLPLIGLSIWQRVHDITYAYTLADNPFLREATSSVGW